jgi:hypothetical protein
MSAVLRAPDFRPDDRACARLEVSGSRADGAREEGAARLRQILRTVGGPALRRGHLPAILFFGAISVFLFRLSLFEGSRFIGNSDRWNHYLSFAAFHASHLARGSLSAWNEYLFTGFDSLAIPFSFVSPLFALPVLAGSDDVVKVLGYVSPVILAATLIVAYAVLYSVCRDRLAATAGAVIYGLSTWSLLKLTQNDNSYLAVVASPILFWLVHTAIRANLARRIAALTALCWVCFYWSFLQYFSYLPLFLAAYCAYLWWRGRRAPGMALAVSLPLAAFLAAPRIWALAQTMSSSVRSAGDDVTPVHFLRFLDTDIFGHSWREAAGVHSLNFSEGNLLFSSIFASLLLIFILLRGRYTAVVGRGHHRVTVRYGFFVLFIVGAFLVVHVPLANRVIRLIYLNMSFLHTRFAFAALLPIALVSSLYLARAGAEGISRRATAAVAIVATGVLVVGSLDLGRITGLGPLLDWGPAPGFMRIPSSTFALLLVSEVVRFLVLSAVFITLVLAHRPAHLLTTESFKVLIAVIIIAQAVLAAEHFLNGAHTRTYDVPFEKNDSVMASAREFLPPTPAQLRTLHEQLDNDRYRSFLVCPETLVPIDCSTGLGMIWRLRLVDGYLSSVARRYRGLPWPVLSTRTSRAIRFSELPAGAQGMDTTPDPVWKLLSFLNVRNAIVVDRDFLTNMDRLVPQKLRIVRNPSPYVYPRAYLAREVRSVDTAEALKTVRHLVGACEKTPAPCSPVLERRSDIDYVEGPVLGPFDGQGQVAWHFDGDRAVLRFPPSAQKRFLVVNEAYDPHWQARAAGRDLLVYPVNVVMRGVVVPEGAGEVTLRYRSVLDFTGPYLAVVLASGGMALLAARRRLAHLLDRAVGQEAVARPALYP